MKHLKTLFTLLLVALATVAFSQSKSLSKANKFYKQKQYADAIPLFEKSLEEKKNTSIQTKLAFCYKSVNQIDKAEKLYSDIVYSDKPRPITFYHYGESLMQNGKYAAAKFWFEEYLKKKPGDTNSLRMIESCDRVNMIKPYFGHVDVSPFSMNSESDDNAPVLWNDQIVFCSDRKQKIKLLKQKSGVTGRDYISLYKSSKLADGTYSEPQSFSSKINGLNKNTGPISFNTAGNYAVFSRNNDIANRRDAYSLALYEAVFEGGKWKNVELLAFCKPDFNYMHPAISPDGKKLFFISDKPGGVGGTEIYSVDRKEDGTWGRPQNMGGFINTEGHEGFPFYDSNDRLFFSSKGHIGFGGYDVFYTQLQDDGSWSRPVNLGFPVNSSSDDISIYVGVDNKSGMFTSGRSGTSDDIYFFQPAQIPVEPEASPVVVNNPSSNSSPTSTAMIEPEKEVTMTVPEVVVDNTPEVTIKTPQVETEEFENFETEVVEIPTTPEVVTEVVETEIQQPGSSLTEVMAEMEAAPVPVIETKVVTDDVIEPTKKKKKRKKKKAKVKAPEVLVETPPASEVIETEETSLTEIMSEMETTPRVETEVVVETPTTPEVVTEIIETEVQQPERSLTDVMAEMEAAPVSVTETEVVIDEVIEPTKKKSKKQKKKKKKVKVQTPEVVVDTPTASEVIETEETSLTEIMAEMETTPRVETNVATNDPVIKTEVEAPTVVTEVPTTEIIEPPKLNVKPEMVEETLAIDATDLSTASTLAPGNALSEFNGDLSSKAIDIEKTYQVPNADFDFNEVNLKSPLTTALDELANILVANPNIEIQLIGHTASFGNNLKNQQLSEARAKIAAAYLMDKGVERHRVNHIGFGETQLLNECMDGILCSMDQHKVNERLEVKVMRH